jgi:hypothetical protein
LAVGLVAKTKLKLLIPSISSSSSSSSNNKKPVSPPTSSSNSSSSSSNDEQVEAKRLKLDPDYVPSGTSEGTMTGTDSQEVSELEEEEKTETEEDSWEPSDNTESEIISSPDDDDSL